MTQAQFLLEAVGGGIASLLAVLFTKLNAAALKRANLAAVLSTVAGLVVAVTSDGFDSKLMTDKVMAIAAAAIVAIGSGHVSWKAIVQPRVEAGAGAIGALATRTAGFGLG